MIDLFKISEPSPTMETVGNVRLTTDRAVYTEYAEQCKREGLTVSEALTNLMREHREW